MIEYSRLNYLHYGNALPLLERHVTHGSPEPLLKSDFLMQTFDGSADNPFLKSVVLSYGEPRAKKLCAPSLAQDVRASVSAHELFRSLGCRGFSHSYVTHITGFPYHLRRQVNFRVAIVSRRELFYPKRVRRYLQRHVSNHYFVGAYPSIAFALGRIIGRKLYVAILQSDIAFSSASYIRDHFRGWRKVLFSAILRHAVNEVDYVYLCPSSVVMEGTFLHEMKPEKTPESWMQIYDRTAKDFGMKPVALRRAVDIQIYGRKKAVHCQSFYELKINRTVRHRLLKIYGDLWQD